MSGRYSKANKMIQQSNWIRFIALCLMLVLGYAVAQAQLQPRDYAIDSITVDFNDDLIIVSVDVVNNGGNAVRDTTASLINLDDGARVLAETTIPIILSGEATTIRFQLPRERFAVDTPYNLRVEAGVDLYELAGTQIALDNVRDLSLIIPEDLPRWGMVDDGRILLDGVAYTAEELLPFVGIGALGLLLLWLVTIILRLIFRRPPTFGTWQPPYATVPTLHPDSVAGRRQAWQQHAQNSLILSPPHEGTPYAVKNLLSEDGRWLVGWQVVALRCSQYDQYGRVTRTQYIAPGGLLRQINRIMSAYGTSRFEKRIQRVTRTIAKEARKRFGKKNLFLPVAIDMRWEGAGGSVRIQFQLYQAQGGQWVLLDEWQPQMMIMPARFQEHTTYTIHGQTSGEKPKEYFQRLERDLAWLFAQTFNPRLPAPSSNTSPPTETEERPQHVQYDVPDTLSNMQPVDVDNLPPQPQQTSQ